MAFLKTHNLASGVAGSYLRITRLNVDYLGQSVEVYVGLYVDKAHREADEFHPLCWVGGNAPTTNPDGSPVTDAPFVEGGTFLLAGADFPLGTNEQSQSGKNPLSATYVALKKRPEFSGATDDV